VKVRVDGVRNLIWVLLFAIAFAYVESSVVAYLRALYYPEGFMFPLKILSHEHLLIELVREAATLIMLLMIAVIAGKGGWERFGYFIIVFGVWDIFYYVWLKVILNWPLTVTDWDILFLIPVPWLGPVIAPILIASLMAVFGIIIVIRVSRGGHFHPRVFSWTLWISGSALILYSFMSDIPATLHEQYPSPYKYWLLISGLLLYCISFIIACKSPLSRKQLP